MKICLCWFTSHNCQILWNPASAVFYVLLLEPYRFHLLLFLHGMRRAPCRDLHSLLLHCTWLIPSWILTPVFILDDACTSCRILPRLFLHCSWHYVILVLLFLHHMGLTTFWILPLQLLHCMLSVPFRILPVYLEMESGLQLANSSPANLNFTRITPWRI